MLLLLQRKYGSLHLRDKNLSIRQRLKYITFKESLAPFLKAEQPALIVMESDAGYKSPSLSLLANAILVSEDLGIHSTTLLEHVIPRG